jgi:protein O-mannosyl-transferase
MSKQNAKKTPVKPTKTAQKPAETTNSTLNWLIPVFAIVIIAATWMAFRSATDNQFVNWDDQTYVSENPLFTPVTAASSERIWDVVISNNYHPLTMWSLLKNVQSNGLKAGPIISLNIWLHVACSLLVFWFFGWLSRGQWWAAGFTGLLFAIHPMHVESVVWVSERKDVLYVFFGMLSLLAYLAYLRKDYNLGWLGLALGLFALSCLSKAMAVVLPVLMLLVDYWEGRKMQNMRVFIEKTPFFALSLLFGLIAMDVQKGGNFHGWFDNIEIRNAITASAFGLGDKFKFAGYGLLQYVVRFFAPFGLSTYHPYPMGTAANAAPYWAGALFLLSYVGTLAWSFFKGKKTLAFGLAWGLVSVALVLQFISVGAVIMAERYTYLPYAGMAFALIYGLFFWGKERLKWPIVGILAVFSLFCTWRTIQQVEVWQDSIALWSRVIEIYPDDAAAYTKRGTSWGKERNDLEKAKADFERAIQLNPNEQYGYEGLGIIAGFQGDHNKALEMFSKCIELAPNYHNFHFNRAVAYVQNKQPDKAVPDCEKAIALNSGNYTRYVPVLADALFLSNQGNKALAVCNEAIAKGVQAASIYLVRAQVHLNQNNREAAKADVQKALQLEPNNALAKQLSSIVF